MADDIMAQMGFGVADEGSEERMRGVAKQLRGDRNLGNLFQFSGSQAVRDAGKGISEQAQKATTAIGTRRAQGLTRAAQKARDDEARRRNAYSEGRDVTQDKLTAEKYETAQGRLKTQDELAAEALQYQRTQAGFETATEMQALETAERERAEDERNKQEAVALKHKNDMEAQRLKDDQAALRARIKADGDAKSQNLMGATEKKNYRLARAAATEMPDIMSLVDATPSAFGAGKDLVAYGPDWMPNMATEGIKVAQNKALSDDEQQARNAVFNKAYRIINSLAGAALSKHEKDRIDAFTPTTNDDARTVKNKLIDMERFVQDKYNSFDMYSDYKPLPEAEVVTVDETVTEDIEAGLSTTEQSELDALKLKFNVQEEVVDEVVRPPLGRGPRPGAPNFPPAVQQPPQTGGLVKSRAMLGRGRG